MKKFRIVSLGLTVCLTLAACTSVGHYPKIDEAVARGDYPAGYALLEAVKEDAYRPKDMVLYYLDAGMLAHFAQDYKASSKLLGEGERAIETAFTKSISQGASSFLVNDNTIEYPGEDYEDIYLNIFNALNYYHTGSMEGALVEIRRIDLKLKYLSTKYGTSISSAQKAALEKSSEVPYDPQAVQVKFSNSALARYVSMLFYRSEGKRDDARIDRDQIKLAFASQPMVYNFSLPTSLDAELTIPAGKARLNIISFNGSGPIKQELVNRIEFGQGNWMKIAVPVLIERPSMLARTEVVLDTGERFELDLIENLGSVAAETFKQRSALIYLKTVIRSFSKTATSAALQKESNRSKDNSALLGLLSIGAQVYAEASEQADLRIAHYFPSKALVGGINLAPGSYSFTIQYYDKANALVHSIRYENIAVSQNQLNLVEAICIK